MKKNRSLIKIAIVVSKFNTEITESLQKQCFNTFVEKGLNKNNIKTFWVPGAYELPFIANRLAKSKKYSAIVCLGCIIKGETSHDEHIANWVSTGIGMAGLQTNVPISFGVLTTKNEKQAKKRSSKGPLNRGKEAALAALEMIDLLSKGLN